MTNTLVPATDYLAAYHEIINRIDAIEKRIPPKRKRNRNTPTCSFQCPNEMYQQISEIATGLALSRSELLRSIVKDYLSLKNKPQGFGKKSKQIITREIDKEASKLFDDDDLIDL